MAKLRKVILKRREVVRILEAFGATELERTGSSHRQYEVIIDGVKRKVTVDDSIDDFDPSAGTFPPLKIIVQKQMQISWDDFYAADEDVAKRAGIPHRPPP